MTNTPMSRRSMILAAGASLATISAKAAIQTALPQHDPPRKGTSEPVPPTPDQERRLKWWREARYGMFIHYGLYSLHARQEWAME
jgi:alpha-L-fucosidase